VEHKSIMGYHMLKSTIREIRAIVQMKAGVVSAAGLLRGRRGTAGGGADLLRGGVGRAGDGVVLGAWMSMGRISVFNSLVFFCFGSGAFSFSWT
jgi:hypothetical protein